MCAQELGPAPTTITVCEICGETGEEPAGTRCPGAVLKDRLQELVGCSHPHLRVKAVPCLAACGRPVAVAFQSPNRWSYILTGIDPIAHAAEIVTLADAIARSPHGIPAMADRPAFFREAVLGRLPPVSQIPIKDND